MLDITMTAAVAKSYSEMKCWKCYLYQYIITSSGMYASCLLTSMINYFIEFSPINTHPSVMTLQKM